MLKDCLKVIDLNKIGKEIWKEFKNIFNKNKKNSLKNVLFSQKYFTRAVQDQNQPKGIKSYMKTQEPDEWKEKHLNSLSKRPEKNQPQK